MIIVRGEGSLARCVLTWRVAMLVVFGLAACGGNDRPPAPHPIFSPNAEILAVKQPQDKLDVCTNALIAWFRRVDTNHDGRIDHDEFVADADRWFSVVDADHDGFAEPAETLGSDRFKLNRESDPNHMNRGRFTFQVEST
jgi:hypothetical protein